MNLLKERTGCLVFIGVFFIVIGLISYLIIFFAKSSLPDEYLYDKNLCLERASAEEIDLLGIVSIKLIESGFDGDYLVKNGDLPIEGMNSKLFKLSKNEVDALEAIGVKMISSSIKYDYIYFAMEGFYMEDNCGYLLSSNTLFKKSKYIISYSKVEGDMKQFGLTTYIVQTRL